MSGKSKLIKINYRIFLLFPHFIPSLYLCHPRALFEYDASKETGCPGEGLSFKHGDILHVLNGSDEEWWQASLVGPLADDGPQGLIPSKQRVERRSRAGQKSVKFTRGEGESDKGGKVKMVNDGSGMIRDTCPHFLLLLLLLQKARTSFKFKLPFGKKSSSSGIAGAEDSEEPKGKQHCYHKWTPHCTMLSCS